MAFITKTIPRANVLHVQVEGEFELEMAEQHFLEMISALEGHPGAKILFDGRGIIGDPTVIERFYYGDFVANAVRQYRERKGPENNPPFAYVMFEPVLDKLRLGETVAANRGMNVKAFDNLGMAVAWLKLTPEDLED